jgi:hypothetical protein
MDWLLLAAAIGLPLIKILLFPARTMGRGGNWTFVGAALLVALMMAIWFGMQSFSDVNDDLAKSGGKAQAAGSAEQLPDLDQLAKLL